MTGMYGRKKSRTRRMAALLIALLMAGSILLTSCGQKPLSKIIVGEWRGEFDIAAMFAQELAYETGVYVELDPVYCDFVLICDKDGSYTLEIDPESVRKAMDKITKKVLKGSDNAIVSSVVEYIKDYIMQELESEDLKEYGTYEVFAENGYEYVDLNSNSGSTTELERTEDKTLLYDDGDMTIEFRK